MLPVSAEFSISQGISDFNSIVTAVLGNELMGTVVGVVVVGTLVFFVWRGLKS